MRRIFADTYYWIALTNPRDQGHQKAVQLSQELQPFQIITTEDVLTEFLNYSSDRGKHTRSTALQLTKQVLSDPSIAIFYQQHERFQAGLELYESRPDKGYSLTDCTTMNLMHQETLNEILTNDEHFAQEGFICLFR